MSLRIRLTLLYSLLLGSFLLLFSGMVYGLISVILIDRIDQTLKATTSDLLQILKVNSTGQFNPRSIATYKTTENLLIQVWGADHQLQLSRPTGKKDALDRSAFSGETISFSSVDEGETQIRVMTTPLTSIRGTVGILQVGVDMTLVQVVQDTLSTILIYLMAAALIITSLVIWIFTGRVLKPLTDMTNISTQIANADDLARRVNIINLQDDEVGKMALAFNKTLARLEKLFVTQQRFLGDVSHELRTPLTVIKGNIGMIRKFGPDEESMESIEDEVDRLNRMVGDLLLLHQAESGVMPLDMIKVDLDVILTEVLKQMGVLAANKVGLKLTAIEPAAINGDKDRLKQVFINLISNSIYYSQRKGTVRVSLQKVNDRAMVTIIDDGPGISEGDLPHIFERFYRGDKARTRTKTSGFGLGLSIANMIVEKHCGKIEVESKIGKGTTFRVDLPLAKE
jgi:signal transduction histidine kinase